MIEFGAFLDTAIAFGKRFWKIAQSILAPMAPLLLMLLALSHCSDKRHTRQRDEARATIAQMELASKQARAAQIAANMATEARYRAESEKTDADYRKALEGALRAADRYALGHRVRPDCSRSPGPAIAAPENPTPPDNDGPGPMPDMVAVPRPEFEDFVANTIRLDQIVNGYGKGLIEEGLAVKPVTAADIPEVGF